jgi:hypothetical protein
MVEYCENKKRYSGTAADGGSGRKEKPGKHGYAGRSANSST